MIAAFMLHHRREVGAHFMRLAKSPANFALKYLGRSPSTAAILERLPSGLDICRDGPRPEASLKPVVEAVYKWWQGCRPTAGRPARSPSRRRPSGWR